MLDARRVIDLYNVTVRRQRVDGARGLTCKTKDGYVVLIDDRQDEVIAHRTLLHELTHIAYGHLDERVELSTSDKEAEVRTALKAMGY